MPPEITDEVEDMEAGSSTAPETDVADAAASPAATDPATSSSATDETDASALSVVRDVVEQREAGETEAASSAEGEEVVGAVADDPNSKAADDYSDVPFNKHPRFQALISERNALRTDSTEYRKITSFLEDNGLTAAEAADGIQIMALMKLDPVKAWEALKPRVQNLLIAAGEVLPDDLAKQVTDKILTREGALQISRARAALATQEARSKFDKERGERRQQQDASTQLVNAAATWESDRQLKDPNFAAKMPRIQEKLAFLHNVKRERPTDAAGVTAQLKAVYAEVNKEFKAPVAAAAPVAGARPVTPMRKPAITPVRGGSVAATAQVSKKPMSTLEIVRARGGARQSA